MLTPVDKDLLLKKGIDQDTFYQQIEFFKKGIPYLNIVKPAIVKDGIFRYDDSQLDQYIQYFDSLDREIVKFVPASGAATRMFKSLFEHLEKKPESIMAEDVAGVLHNISAFAFYPDLIKVLKNKGLSLDELIQKNHHKKIIESILFEEGLNYGNLPKGLLCFHSYSDGNRTSMEEHMVEGALYAKGKDGKVNIHFTVSPEHVERFKQLVDNVKNKYSIMFKVDYQISFSIQKSSTDTIAVDDHNEPFRDSDGNMVFRPGGHGALLDNLNDIQGDIVFIKNIDNVVPDRMKEDTVRFKKALAGILLKAQTEIFELHKKLENNLEDVNLQNKVIEFIEAHIGFSFPADFRKMSRKQIGQKLCEVLDRPIRVCGMVKNEGEPGGGPYWVKQSDGSLSLQILESSQFNMNDLVQKDIFKNATHFNPVDLVVSLRDRNGKKFDLLKFRDPQTGFISSKSKDGKALKAFELPGLWNGSMAYWNTIFVEVPITTFNPVKTINDLIRKEHQ